MVTLDSIADFLCQSRPTVIGQWPRGQLLGWLDFHARQGAVAVAVADGQIVGVGVGVRCEPGDMDDPWTRWNDRGACFYVHQIAATTHDGLLAVISLMTQRVPEWEKLRFAGHRHGRRVRCGQGFVRRIWQAKQRQALKEF